VVFSSRSGKSKPYNVEVQRGGKKASLGHFATAEEAALCRARSPEGRAAVAAAAAHHEATAAAAAALGGEVSLPLRKRAAPDDDDVARDQRAYRVTEAQVAAAAASLEELLANAVYAAAAAAKRKERLDEHSGIELHLASKRGKRFRASGLRWVVEQPRPRSYCATRLEAAQRRRVKRGLMGRAMRPVQLPPVQLPSRKHEWAWALSGSGLRTHTPWPVSVRFSTTRSAGVYVALALRARWDETFPATKAEWDEQLRRARAGEPKYPPVAE